MTPLVDYFQTPPWSRHAVGIAAVAGISMLACRLLLSKIIFEPARLKDAKESLDSVHSNTSEAPKTGFIFDATKNQDAVQKRLDAGKVTVSRIMVYPIKVRLINLLHSQTLTLGDCAELPWNICSQIEFHTTWPRGKHVCLYLPPTADQESLQCSMIVNGA